MRIQKRITSGFLISMGLTAVASVFATIAIIFMVLQYNRVLQYNAFPQGDIGHAMAALADVRSATRGAIGYEEQAMIDKMVTTHDEKKEELYKYLDVIETSIVTKAGQENYDDIVKDIEEYMTIDQKCIELGATEDVALCKQAQEMAVDKMAPAYEEAYSALQGLMDTNVTLGDKNQRNLKILAIVLIIATVAIITVAGIIANRIGKIIAKGIADPMHELGGRLDEFAKGDVSSPFPSNDANDEVGDMVRVVGNTTAKLQLIIADLVQLLGDMANGNFNINTSCEDEYVGEFNDLLQAIRTMNRQMDAALKDVNNAADMVSAGAGDLAEASQAMAEGATDQAASVEEMQATMDEITTGLENSYEEVNKAYDKAKDCAMQAETSRSEMANLMTAMDQISDTSQKIENIIGEIEDIASQTNLLSLNAAIEAARAGEAGKGFAVVADQIRNLAEQSAQSAVNTRELIESAISEVNNGNEAALKTSEVLGEVVKSIQSIAETSKLLSQTSARQSEAMKEADAGINRISEVVQANSATSEEISATSEELSAQAVNMDEMVSRFELRK
ncbi:MAG: methyl-accepting chemotaxis protein [Butyribacter sp.]|nr:methyl-accepting chemotaxis protein [Butyribacter sp.]